MWSCKRAPESSKSPVQLRPLMDDPQAPASRAVLRCRPWRSYGSYWNSGRKLTNSINKPTHPRKTRGRSSKDRSGTQLEAAGSPIGEITVRWIHVHGTHQWDQSVQTWNHAHLPQPG